MQTLIRFSVVMACCIACSSAATAQVRRAPGFDRDRDFRSGRDIRSDRDFRSDRDTRSDRNRVAKYIFAKRAHLPRLAKELYEQSNAVCWESYRNYHHNRGYKTTYREMFEIRKATKHVGQLIKENYYRSRHDSDDIERDLYRIENWVNHVQRDIRDWKPDHSRARRTPSLQSQVAELEETLEHLMEDYGTKSKIDRAARRRNSRRSRN